MPKIPKHRRVLGDNLRSLRKAAALSQEALAERADLHHNYIGDIERGEETVSVDTLMRIANALNCTFSDIVKGL